MWRGYTTKYQHSTAQLSGSPARGGWVGEGSRPGRGSRAAEPCHALPPHCEGQGMCEWRERHERGYTLSGELVKTQTLGPILWFLTFVGPENLHLYPIPGNAEADALSEWCAWPVWRIPISFPWLGYRLALIYKKFIPFYPPKSVYLFF